MTDFGNRNSTPIKFPVNPRLVNSGLLGFCAVDCSLLCSCEFLVHD